MSDRIPDGWTQIKTWTALEVLHASLVLDYLDAAQREYEARTK